MLKAKINFRYFWMKLVIIETFFYQKSFVLEILLYPKKKVKMSVCF